MIMTCVERKSGYLVAAKMKDGTSARLNAAKERAFRSVPQKLRQTLTVDNGKEFAGHERLSLRLAMTICFAHPYPSNERATNENTNGLLRQYFPKKIDFRDISPPQSPAAALCEKPKASTATTDADGKCRRPFPGSVSRSAGRAFLSDRNRWRNRVFPN